MKILVINSGSSSLKYQLFDMDSESVVTKGVCERIGTSGSELKGSVGKSDFVLKHPMPNHVVAIRFLLDCMTQGEYAVIRSVDEINAVGHRVVHSGGIYNEPVLINDEVIERMKETFDLAPLHNPANIDGAVACRELMPKTPMALIFDTAFHSTMPDYAYMYGIAYDDYKKYKIRKYGFHGTSHKYVAQEAAKALGKDIKQLKIVTCHLGNGASVAAVKDGASVDTSMGFTPLEGLVMGTRCGDMDLAALEYLCNKKGLPHYDGVHTYANKECGVLGISGISSDFRDLTKASDEGNERATLAINMFAYRVKKYIGAYAAAMGGVDCIVFTAGIGEHTPIVREKVVQGMEFLGVKMDLKANEKPVRGKLTVLNTPDSKVKILLVPTDEELVIAKETQRLLK